MGQLGLEGSNFCWLYPGRSVFLQAMCPMREFREYFPFVTRQVTSGWDVNLACHRRPPDRPRGARVRPRNPLPTRRFGPCHVPVTEPKAVLAIKPLIPPEMKPVTARPRRMDAGAGRRAGRPVMVA